MTGDGKRYYENTLNGSTTWVAPLGAIGGSTGRFSKVVDVNAAICHLSFVHCLTPHHL